MAVKHYVDEIPPSTGRTYYISVNGNNSKITDTTVYQQVGSGFGASDVNSTCVLECNYTKGGTVHHLISENTSCENVKFFATSAFTKGDTFTFNGETVTARTIDGKKLDTNFFVANTIVECFRKDNVLYFESSSESIIDDTTGESYHFGIDNGVLYIEED